MFTSASYLRVKERPPLQFAAIVLAAPPNWTDWGKLRVTALNHGGVAADLRRICRGLRWGGRIVSMLEVARFDEATQQQDWPKLPQTGSLRCSDITEYQVPQAQDGEPGSVTFDVLIKPGRGITMLSYPVEYRWVDLPGETVRGVARP